MTYFPTVDGQAQSNLDVTTYDSPSAMLRATGPALRSREKEANVILPLLLKLAQLEKANTTGPSSTSAVPNFWIVVRSIPANSSKPTVDFVLSCTNGAMGAYPIFIWSSKPVRTMTQDFIHCRVSLLAEVLKSSLASTRRVYSVFAPTPIARAFATTWTILTGHEAEETPYYHAALSSISKSSLRINPSPNRPESSSLVLRKAVAEDEAGVAELCFEFAATSEPFILDEDGALKEARILISQGQVYVCQIHDRIACMVAITRSSERCAAITKVVTHPEFFSRGLAKALVSDVCTRLLHNEDEDHVVLYVGLGNTAAERAYRAVGFSGLLEDSQTVASRTSDVDSEWLELGFEGTELGHW